MRFIDMILAPINKAKKPFKENERSTSRLAVAFEKLWLRLAVYLRDSVPKSVFIEAVRQNKPGFLLDKLPADLGMGHPLVRKAKTKNPNFIEVTEEQLLEAMHQRYLKEGKDLKVDFGGDVTDFDTWLLKNPKARLWAKKKSALLVSQISTSTREAIRQAVTLAYESGIHSAEAAKIVQRSIGLLPRQNTAIQNQIGRMKEQGLNAASIERRVAAMQSRMLRERAKAIALTEMNAAQNRGRQLSWDEAIAAGDLPRSTKQTWISGVAEPTCEICLELHEGQPIPVGEMFESSYVGEIEGPPAHTNCRCSVAAVFDD